MNTVTENKFNKLKSNIKKLNKIVVGFSGGVGGENVWAVTGDSESLMPEELTLCRELAGRLGLSEKNFIEIKTNEIEDPDYRKNPVDRCFYCKNELFGNLNEIADKMGAQYVLDGSNADDLHDWRPGREAAKKLNVISPLAEAGITKEEIREIARDLGLPNWDKPALACLASRIPYGSEITAEKLFQIAEAERLIKSLGFSQFRVRHHGEMARLEFLKEEISEVFRNGLVEKISSKLKSLGFTYVTVDLQGYRSGSMNENINKGGKE
jgi:uncharacterized protein